MSQAPTAWSEEPSPAPWGWWAIGPPSQEPDPGWTRLQGAPLPGEVPVQWIQALPHAGTVAPLAGFFGRAQAPKAFGVPYAQERWAHRMSTLPPPTVADLDRLLQAARAVRGHAHAPYSRFAVGAALLDEHGRVHAGCNVENAAYPQSLCAEAVALGVLVAAGGTRVRAAVVVGEAAQPVTPCGGCRQKLREFAADDCPVCSADGRGWRARHTLGALLPDGFGPDHLARGAARTGTTVDAAPGTAPR